MKYRNAEHKWKHLGNHFGYPRCCINDFCHQVTLRSQMRAGNHSGFVPCKKHSRLVLLKKATLGSLIRNRKDHRPFREW